MSSFPVRLAVTCCVLAAVAVVVPKMAPQLVGLFAPPPSADVAVAVTRSRPRGGYRVAIAADPQGHFLAEATVEGRALRVMIDTGATTVALTADTARRLGLRLTDADYSARISTANGTAAAAPVMLSEIRVGDISVRHVAAVVVPGDALDVNLLGMSFLSRLTRFEVGGGQLVLSD